LLEKQFRPLEVDRARCFTDAIFWRGLAADIYMQRHQQTLQQESNPEKKAFLVEHMLESTGMITVLIVRAHNQTQVGQTWFQN
jgi:hypothetical protein